MMPLVSVGTSSQRKMPPKYAGADTTTEPLSIWSVPSPKVVMLPEASVVQAYFRNAFRVLSAVSTARVVDNEGAVRAGHTRSRVRDDGRGSGPDEKGTVRSRQGDDLRPETVLERDADRTDAGREAEGGNERVVDADRGQIVEGRLDAREQSGVRGTPRDRSRGEAAVGDREGAARRRTADRQSLDGVGPADFGEDGTLCEGKSRRRVGWRW